jgi:hypothetical protein
MLGWTNYFAVRLKNRKITTRKCLSLIVHHHIVPLLLRKCVVFFYKAIACEVCYLLKFKFFCNTSFNSRHIAHLCSKLLHCCFYMKHPPLLNRTTYLSFICKIYKEMLCIGLKKPSGNIFSNPHISIGASFSSRSTISHNFFKT